MQFGTLFFAVMGDEIFDMDSTVELRQFSRGRVVMSYAVSSSSV